MSGESKIGWMSEIYNGFFLRDVLSFVVPGSLAIIGAYVTLFRVEDVKNLLNNLLELKDMSIGVAIGVYIIAFGVTYVIGFLIQALGIMLKIIKFYRKSSIDVFDNKVNFKDVSYGIYKKCCNERNKYYRIAFYNMRQEFLRCANERERQHDERNIVLRQMIGNTAVSLLIVTICGIVRFIVDRSNAHYMSIFILIIIVVVLLIEHHTLLDREFDWRITILARERKIS